MNAATAFANFRPVAGVMVEFQHGVVHTEPDDRENPSSNVAFLPIISAQKSHLSDADKDAGCGLRLRPCGLLVSSVTGQRCRWLAPTCQVAVCLAWNWCLRFLVAALVRWLLGPLERFLSAYRWGIVGCLVAALSLHLVWQDLFRLFIWAGVTTFALWYWAMWHWPAGRVA